MAINQRMLRWVILFIALLCVGFIGIQFIRPKLSNPPVLADLQAPDTVKGILQTSCYNCHSNETRLPWYDEIVPAYWLVVHDVARGRMHLNFSDFGKLPPGQQKGFLYESASQIQLGAMPPRNYTLIHPESIVSAEQLATLKNYLHPHEETTPADPSEIAASDAAYQKWIAAAAPTSNNAQPVPNGLAFFPDYKNWKTVSTTERFDNDTLRVILGNDVAVRAITENRIHPWPNGAAFAKIAWKQQRDDKGIVNSGEFYQVEFMVKDSSKYASTEGWGFGRWRGTALAPYGKDANFTFECTSCHAPMRRNDFVFTTPISDQSQTSDLFNREAALHATLPYHPLQWRVITSFIDKPSATMSTLYGNDIAVTHARTNPQQPYPAGAILSLVTWRQQEDAHWFGARIPSQVKLIEFVIFGSGADDGKISYQAYEGGSLMKTSDEDPNTQTRINTIISQRAAVMP